LHWIEQIHDFTFEHGDSSSPLELGLLNEIRSLASKDKMLSALVNVCESGGVKQVLLYLECSSSPFIILFQEALLQLKRSLERVHETSKQLAHLEGPLDGLYSDSVHALTDHIYDVLGTLRIIWSHSEHYRCVEVMTELCVRVS
ncbi:unnamed protein product, partial [Meganyctiphanes norvegica]